MRAPMSSLYLGTVWHKRSRPKVHAFRYPIFYVMLDLDLFEPPGHTAQSAQGKPSALPRGLSLDRFNIFSLYQRDYGDMGTPGISIKQHIQSLASDGGCSGRPQKIMMLTMPRILGYSFNPLTTFYCYGADDRLMAILYEVHNTFGERHTYVFPISAEGADIPRHEADKKFHVSPFFDIEGSYLFSQKKPGDQLSLTIRYKGADGGHNMTACLKARQVPLTAGNLARLFFQIPLVTVKVTAAIHYEALRLWLKRLRVFTKPALPGIPFSAAKARRFSR